MLCASTSDKNDKAQAQDQISTLRFVESKLVFLYFDTFCKFNSSFEYGHKTFTLTSSDLKFEQLPTRCRIYIVDIIV